MKEFIIISVIAFFATAWVFDTGTPPQPVKVGISGVQTGVPSHTKRVDELYGDFKITDGYKPAKLRYMIYDDKDQEHRETMRNSRLPAAP